MGAGAGGSGGGTGGTGISGGGRGTGAVGGGDASGASSPGVGGIGGGGPGPGAAGSASGGPGPGGAGPGGSAAGAGASIGEAVRAFINPAARPDEPRVETPNQAAAREAQEQTRRLQDRSDRPRRRNIQIRSGTAQASQGGAGISIA